MSKRPSAELGANGPDVGGCIREAVEALTAPSQRDGGRFTKSNTDAGKTLRRSDAFWNAVASARAAIVERVTADSGDGNNAPETMRRLLDAYAETSLFRESMYVRLVESGGPITNKGRTRALFTAYLSALDRELKLAQVIGLERRAKHVPSLEQALRGGDR